MPIGVRNNKLKHVGALEGVNALLSQQAHRIEIGCWGQAMFLRNAAGHPQLTAGQPLAANGVNVCFAARLKGSGCRVL